MSNLRPINILSIFSKIIEKVLTKQISEHLIQKNLVNINLQGGLKKRSSTYTIVSLMEKLYNLKISNITAVIVTSDQSAAYDLLDHKILEKKLKHIGIKFSSVNMIMSFLNNRYQFTQINTHDSPTLLNKPVGCYQGSVFSSLLFLIYTLDIIYVSHNKPHNNHLHYNQCNNPNIMGYVDDSYGVITEPESVIWNRVKSYISSINKYYIDNRLINNISK